MSGGFAQAGAACTSLVSVKFHADHSFLKMHGNGAPHSGALNLQSYPPKA